MGHHQLDALDEQILRLIAGNDILFILWIQAA